MEQKQYFAVVLLAVCCHLPAANSFTLFSLVLTVYMTMLERKQKHLNRTEKLAFME